MLETIRKIAEKASSADSAHDFSHSMRVLANALLIAQSEGGDVEVLTAAAYLHDIANLPKNHPESHLSSERSAEHAAELLEKEGFSEDKLLKLKDAILCHSFSRGLMPKTLEGKVFQDADRLDSLGAVGIARTCMVGGALARPLYDIGDPFLTRNRKPNDKENTVDHFYVKLFKLANTMQTPTGKKIALERTERMKRFLDELKDEVEGTPHHQR